MMVADLKRFSHRIAELADTASSARLNVGPEYAEVSSHIQEADVAIEARYIVTGFKRQVSNDYLSQPAALLDQKVCASLMRRGLPVRSQDFNEDDLPKPIDPNALEPDTWRVLLWLFKTEGHEQRGVRFIARALQLQESLVRYHLDELGGRNFAILGSLDDMDEYWSIMPEGRKYVVRNGLHERDE